MESPELSLEKELLEYLPVEMFDTPCIFSAAGLFSSPR
jgi:hypothetical protein